MLPARIENRQPNVRTNLVDSLPVRAWRPFVIVPTHAFVNPRNGASGKGVPLGLLLVAVYLLPLADIARAARASGSDGRSTVVGRPVSSSYSFKSPFGQNDDPVIVLHQDIKLGRPLHDSPSDSIRE